MVWGVLGVFQRTVHPGTSKCTKMNQHISPATLEEVQYAIKRLKTNKAADYMDLNILNMVDSMLKHIY